MPHIVPQNADCVLAAAHSVNFLLCLLLVQFHHTAFLLGFGFLLVLSEIQEYEKNVKNANHKA